MRFARSERGASAAKYGPLTVITADERDRLSAAVEATHVRLDSILKRFHRTFPSRARSMSELLDSYLAGDYGFPDRVREIIGQRFISTLPPRSEKGKDARRSRPGDLRTAAARIGPAFPKPSIAIDVETRDLGSCSNRNFDCQEFREVIR